LNFQPTHDDVGTIYVTFWVSDSSDVKDIVLASIVVENTNDPPEISIVEPTLFTYKVNTPINFSASISDIDEVWEAQHLAVTWNSNTMGDFGQGETIVNFAGLSLGTHEITATVRDAGGLTASDTITVTIAEEEVVKLPGKEAESSLWLWIILIVIILVVVFALILIKKKKPPETESAPSTEGELVPSSQVKITPVTPVGGIAGAPLVTPPGTSQLPAPVSQGANLLLPKADLSTDPTQVPLKPSGAPSVAQETLLQDQQKKSVQIDQLERLAELKDQGIITEDEFIQQKQEVLLR